MLKIYTFKFKKGSKIEFNLYKLELSKSRPHMYKKLIL